MRKRGEIKGWKKGEGFVKSRKDSGWEKRGRAMVEVGRVW